MSDDAQRDGQDASRPEWVGDSGDLGRISRWWLDQLSGATREDDAPTVPAWRAAIQAEIARQQQTAAELPPLPTLPPEGILPPLTAADILGPFAQPPRHPDDQPPGTLAHPLHGGDPFAQSGGRLDHPLLPPTSITPAATEPRRPFASNGRPMWIHRPPTPPRREPQTPSGPLGMRLRAKQREQREAAYSTPPPFPVPGRTPASQTLAQAQRGGQTTMATISRYDPLDEIASTLRSVPPVDVVSMVRLLPTWVIGQDGRWESSRDGLGIRPEELPPNIPAMFYPKKRQILLNVLWLPKLSPQELQAVREGSDVVALHPEWLRYIERERVLRFLTACCWIRWYCWGDITAAALNCHIEDVPRHPMVLTSTFRPRTAHAVGFRPLAPSAWRQEYHPRLYSRFWLRLSEMLCNTITLQRHTASYLGISRAQVAPLGRPLQQQIEEHDRRIGRAPEHAWARFVRELARESKVPEVMVQRRLEGDPPITSFADYRELNDQLLDDLTELLTWRYDLSHRWHRPPQTIGLWLAEPMGEMLVDARLSSHAS